MTDTSLKNKFFQAIAIRLYSIDRGFLFSCIKDFHIGFRYLFYIGITICFYVSMSYIGSLIDLSNWDEIYVLVFNFLGQVVFYSCLILLSLTVTYESILDHDVKAELQKIKAEKDRIKKEKKQWWRLSNMHLVMRLFLYFIVYFYLQQNALDNARYVVATIPLTKDELYLFLSDYSSTLKLYTFVYIAICLLLEWSVSKKRSKL